MYLNNKTGHYLLFTVFFLSFIYGLPALEIYVSEAGLSLNYSLEHNRSFNFIHNAGLSGGIEFNERYNMGAGFALGAISGEREINAFLSNSFAVFPVIPLVVNFNYIYHGMPGYRMQSHSLLPFISYEGSRAGIALGLNLRTTVFFNDYHIFESIIIIRLYYNIVIGNTYMLGIRLSNFGDFTAGNFGSNSITLYYTAGINENWSFRGEAELMQSGSESQTAVFYGYRLTGGVKYTW